MKTAPTVAVLGATGAVGKQMLICLEERNIQIKELRLFASKRSSGTIMPYKGENICVRQVSPQSFADVDIVLSAVDDRMAHKFVPHARDAGAVVIDNSHAFRLDPEVPLVVPEINSEDVKWHNGIIANPNCATIIALLPTYPLHRVAGLKRMIVSTYQAASGAGVAGLRELKEQTRSIVEGAAVKKPQVFPYQLSYNLIPKIGGCKEEGYTSEELKLQNEGRKIMHLPDLGVNCTCVRVPVLRSHSESITCEFERAMSVDEVRDILADAPGVRVVDDCKRSVFPMPINTSDQDTVLVGRIRQDISAPSGVCAFSFWCCGDQIRKGAATNAVQIMELLLQE